MSRPSRSQSENKSSRADTLAALREAKAGGNFPHLVPPDEVLFLQRLIIFFLFVSAIGKKRSEQFQTEESNKIYDEVEEDDYKRRRNAEDFVVDEGLQKKRSLGMVMVF